MTQPRFALGEPCWIDLSGPDPADSRRFYGDLFGWQFRIDPDPAWNYAYATCSGRIVAGFNGAPEPGAAKWTVYLAMIDVERTWSLVVNNGGRIDLGPLDFPQRGELLLGVEPSGARLGLWRPAPVWKFGSGYPGALYWSDLYTRESGTADRFFHYLFGYHVDGDDEYAEYRYGPNSRLGRARLGPNHPAPGPHWLPYLGVDPQIGVDATVDQALRLGASLRTEPYDTEYSRIAVLGDRAGAGFALIDPGGSTVAPVGTRNDDPYDD